MKTMQGVTRKHIDNALDAALLNLTATQRTSFECAALHAIRELWASEAGECLPGSEIPPRLSSIRQPEPPEEESGVLLRCLRGGKFELSVVMERALPPEVLLLLASHKDPARLIRRALAEGL